MDKRIGPQITRLGVGTRGYLLVTLADKHRQLSSGCCDHKFMQIWGSAGGAEVENTVRVATENDIHGKGCSIGYSFALNPPSLGLRGIPAKCSRKNQSTTSIQKHE